MTTPRDRLRRVELLLLFADARFGWSLAPNACVERYCRRYTDKPGEDVCHVAEVRRPRLEQILMRNDIEELLCKQERDCDAPRHAAWPTAAEREV